MNPNILIYNPDIPKHDAKIISLSDYPDLNIKEAVNPGNFPPEIHHYLGLNERLGYMVETIQEFEE